MKRRRRISRWVGGRACQALTISRRSSTSAYWSSSWPSSSISGAAPPSASTGSSSEAGAVGVAGGLAVEDLLEAEAGGVAELCGGGGASERLGEAFGLAREFEAEVLQAAWDVQRPGLVAEVAFELAQDGGDGEARELGAVAGFEAVDRFDQADRGDLDEVVERFVAVAVAAGQAPRERQVTLDQLVTQPRITRRRDSAPTTAPHSRGRPRAHAHVSWGLVGRKGSSRRYLAPVG